MTGLLVELSGRFGPVELWYSTPASGYFDPNTYPERLLAKVPTGSAIRSTLELATPTTALVLRPTHRSIWPLAYLLTVSLGEHALFTREILSYTHNGKQQVTDRSRSRLHSVDTIPRVGAIKITPSQFRPDEALVSFSPSLPPGATYV